jgi:sugar phosphate isomerase/epimerase
MHDAEVAIGNQTSFSAPTSTFPFEYAIEHQFGAFEWFPDRSGESGFEEPDFSAEKRRDLRNLAIGSDMRISVHGPWWIDLGCPDSQERMKSVTQFARDLGATLINVHLVMDKGLEAFCEGVIKQLGVLAPLNMTLALENTVLTGPEEFIELFGKIKKDAPELYPSLGVCFDMGHANLYRPTHNDYLAWWDQLPEEIPVTHLHVHENWGDSDAHLTLFTGPSSLDPAGVDGLVERLIKRNFNGSLILEQWPSPPELLIAAKARLRAMLDKHAPAAADQVVFDKTKDIAAKLESDEPNPSSEPKAKSEPKASSEPPSKV